MSPVFPRDVLKAVADAQAVWTYHEGELRGEDHLSDLEEHTERLIRALSRLQVLAKTHPDVRVDEALPRGAISADELQAWERDVAFLRALVETPMPPAAVEIVVTAPTAVDEMAAAVLRELDGSTFTVGVFVGRDGTPVHRVDLTPGIRSAVEEFHAQREDSFTLMGPGEGELDDTDDDPADAAATKDPLRRVGRRRAP